MARRATSAVVVLGIALLVAIVGPAGAAGGPATNVFNGDEAVAGSYPFLAWIYYSDGIDNRTCTGTVVASNVVLTAAHCVLRNDWTNNLDPARFVVVTGNVHHLASPHTTSSVTSFAVAPSFRAEAGASHPRTGDCAVLILSQPTPSPPVRLATAQVWSAGTAVAMAGWGQTGLPDPGDGLRTGTSVVQGDSYCAAHLGEFEPALLLCIQDTAQNRYSGCQGDSGGPLLMTAPGTVSEPLEIGIVSFGPGNCSPELPSYLGRADVAQPWVEAEIAANPPPPPAPEPPVPTGDATPREPEPTISSARARARATAVLHGRLGASFLKRRNYVITCREVNLHKQECKVHWKAEDTRYSGVVTVFGTLVAGGVVWYAPYVVHATTCQAKGSKGSKGAKGTTVRSRPSCRVRTFKGGSP
jgi:secreted trypsin-like serine protease